MTSNDPNLLYRVGEDLKKIYKPLVDKVLADNSAQNKKRFYLFGCEVLGDSSSNAYAQEPAIEPTMSLDLNH